MSMSIFCDFVKADRLPSSSFYASLASLNGGNLLRCTNSGVGLHGGITSCIGSKFKEIFLGDFFPLELFF